MARKILQGSPKKPRRVHLTDEHWDELKARSQAMPQGRQSISEVVAALINGPSELEEGVPVSIGGITIGALSSESFSALATSSSKASILQALEALASMSSAR
jgi:hypothetical protein